MSQNAFNFTNLIPDFTQIWNGNFNTSQGISAFIVLLLGLLWVFFLGYAVKKFIEAKAQINFYKQLLENIDQEELAFRQRDLTQQSLAHKNEFYGKLWKEFDETLVFSPDGSRLFNTLDAAHFFNSDNLAKGLTDNRLLAAVPGFLTAIGVIGTFAGLQMGLATLEINQDVGVDVLRQGIGNMISGASIAFLTSVWGVISSVTFNFIEKGMERSVRKAIFNLQNRIDHLYPRINPEQSLVKIADYSRSSTETLQGLAEKIGDRLQEAVIQVTDNIRTGLEDSLNNIMAPAIQSLVENAHQGSQQALDSLLTRFMDGVGEAGSVQREMMAETSKEVSLAVGSLGNQMSDFLLKLEAQSHQANEESQTRQTFLEKHLQDFEKQQSDKQKQLGERFEEMIGSLVDKLNDQQQKAESREQSRSNEFEKQLQAMVTKSNEAIESIGILFTKQLEEGKNLHEARHQAFTENVASFQQVQGDLADRVGALISSQQQGFELIHQKLKGLIDPFQQLAESNILAAQEIMDSAKQMQSVTNQLGLMAATVKQTTDKLSTDIGKAAELTADIAEENHVVSQELQQSLAGYKQLSETMNNIVEKLRGATESAERGFATVHEHLDGFKRSLTNHIVELDEHIQKLLINYADQVQSQTIARLNAWNTQTNDYISLMTGAVRALNDVVDELENKVGAQA